MGVSEQEKAQLFQCERRMAIMIAAKAASSTEGANHDIIKIYLNEKYGGSLWA